MDIPDRPMTGMAPDQNCNRKTVRKVKEEKESEPSQKLPSV
jgi:hypothetical protein